MITFLKLFFSAWFIVVAPYFTAFLSVEFIVNNGWIASNTGLTSGFNTITLMVVIYMLEVLAATEISRRLLFGRQYETAEIGEGEDRESGDDY